MKILKKISIIALIVFLVGALIFVIAFAAGGWNIRNLSTTRTEPRLYEEVAENPISSISVDFDNADVKIQFGEKLSVSYPQKYTKSGRAVTEVIQSDAGGALQIRERTVWHISVGFDFAEQTVVITLPQDRACALKVETDNGDISFIGAETAGVGICVLDSDNGDVKMQDIRAQRLEASTDNGDIDLHGAIVEERLSASTDNGDVDFGKDIIAKELEVDTDNGDISLAKAVINAQSLHLNSDNGDIEARLTGAPTDYTVRVEKGLGKSNISTSSGGAKRLNIECDIGDIEIYFTAG